MPIAVNDSGEALYLSDGGEWLPAKVAENPQTLEKLAFDGKAWLPVKLPRAEGYSLGDVGMAAVRGIPIAGGIVESLSTPEWQRGYKRFDEAHPYLSGAAKIGGGIAALGPLGMTAAGARVLGMTGPTLARQVINSAASGTAIGAADEAVRGGDIGSGAQVGGALGIAGPLAGRTIGRAIGGVQNVAGRVPRVPANFEAVGNVRIPIDRGQASGDVVSQRFLESAKAGVLGSDAQQAVNAFRQSQEAGTEQARQHIRGILGGAETTPLEAAETVQQAIQRQAAAAKGAAQARYDEFGRLRGEVHAGAFEGVGQKIKGDLSLRSEPIVIDDVLTPAASKMITHIDSGIGRMKIQNRADPFGQPSAENIVGVSLKGIDHVRKQLVSMAGGATTNADKRAARSIVSSFDDHLAAAVESKLYIGDPDALGTLREARRLWSTYMQTFKAQGRGDVAGRVIENIGKHVTNNQVANWLYGASKVGGNKESVLVAQRMKNILGDGSADWQAVRQGLFSKLVDTTEGKIPEGPQKVSQRVFEFMNGSGKQLAEQMFSQQERALIKQYGNLMKRLTPVPGSTNPSGSGYQVASMLKWTVNALATIGGLHVGGPLGALAGVASNVLGKSAIERQHGRAVARHLYRDAALPLTIAPRLDQSGALLSRAPLGLLGE